MKKFEFVLYINGNIICQRYFSVKDYNSDVKKSLDLKWSVEECANIIKRDLKAKSVDYLHRQFNPYKPQTKEEVEMTKKDLGQKEDYYEFEIKVDDKQIAKTRFTGNIYPQRVRYSVDVRGLIPKLISSIQDTFSQDYFTVEYNGIEL